MANILTRTEVAVRLAEMMTDNVDERDLRDMYFQNEFDWFSRLSDVMLHEEALACRVVENDEIINHS